MNAQTEQLIYWKQQYDLIRQERDDITRLCAATEQRLEKAVEALYAIRSFAVQVPSDKDVLPDIAHRASVILSAIEEPADA